MSRLKWPRILMPRIEPIARLKSSRQKPAVRYTVWRVLKRVLTLVEHYLRSWTLF